MIDILLIIFALVVGLVAGFFLGRAGSRQAADLRLQSEKSLRESLSQSHAAELERVRRANEEALTRAENVSRENLLRSEEAAKRAATEMEAHHKDSIELMRARFDETIERLQQQISNLTSELLLRRQNEFEQSSRESVARIVAPLEDSLKRMKDAIADNSSRQDRLRGEMQANVESLLRQSELTRISADRLSDALRNGGRIQGQWGETVLTELLESQGLREGTHFHTQAVIRDRQGNAVRTDQASSLRPDVILHLDRARDIVIDAKVSLSSYMDYVNAETDEKKEAALKAHVDSVRKHVRELAAKDYSHHLSGIKESVGYVIMFVPCGPALQTAMEAAPDLWRKAMEANVYIADEQTLYAALKIISMTWTQISQAENHEKVFRLADEMLERVGVFMERFSNVGRQIEAASKSYEDAMAKLSDRGQSIPGTCRKLIALGASVKTRKGVAPELLGLED